MELWVRNQDKDHLVKIEEINIEIDEDGFIGIWSYGSNKYLKYYLGTYKTKERALEVLDEIQNILKPEVIVKTYNVEQAELLNGTKFIQPMIEDIQVQQASTYVYEMPEE